MLTFPLPLSSELFNLESKEDKERESQRERERMEEEGHFIGAGKASKSI